MTEEKFSGKWIQRIPPKLHKQIRAEAKLEGVSLNLYVATVLSRSLGQREGYQAGMAASAEKMDELEKLFELQRTRMRKATKAWRKAHPGNNLVSPDLGQLLDWLLERKKADVKA